MTDRTHGTADAEEVTLWVDPVCAWTWITYKWLSGAAQVRPLSLSVRPTGLATSRGRRAWTRNTPGSWSWPRARCGTGRRRGRARHAGGRSVVRGGGAPSMRRGGLYEGLHERVRGLSVQAKREVQASLLEQARDVVGEALAECGLPARLAAAMGSAEWDEDLRTAHASIPRDGLELEVIGVPVISVGGRVGVFGPVLRSAPAGERAGALWDGFAALVREDAFLELRR
ncbi:hypothetical protein LV779_18150 [Streptomyces thinghirensis]|nr:hypothetical protein [Streptomyces thinghirensis]